QGRYNLIMNNLPSQQAAFTLVEVLVIVAIIGILSAIAGPDLLNMMPGIRLNNAAQLIVNDLQFARMRSISTTREYRINFDASSESYRIEEGDQSIGSTWPGTLIEQERRLNDSSNVFYQKGIDLNSVTQNPVFNSKGLCSTPSTIKIQNNSGGKKKVVINMTGGIKIYDGWD
ncbi:MAG: GspH/FimT family pseudopilin, partial [bacterium]